MKLTVNFRAVLLLSVCMSFFGHANAADAPLWDDVKKLRDAKDALVDRTAISVDFRKRRLASVAALIKLVRDKRVPLSIRLEAVRILEVVRAPEAVDALLSQLTSITAEKFGEKTFETLYPCVPALVKIGKPSSRAVLKELRKPMKKIRRLALAVVLAGVEGRKVGRLLINDEITEADSAAVRKNLKLGLKAFLAMTANDRDYKIDPVRKRKP